MELARKDGVDGMDGVPAGARVADDMAPAHGAAMRPVPRGLERETSLPPPVSSQEIDGADGTYERVGSMNARHCCLLTVVPHDTQNPYECPFTHCRTSQSLCRGYGTTPTGAQSSAACRNSHMKYDWL